MPPRKRATKAAPASGRSFNRARGLFRDGDVRGAIAILGPLVRREPENCEALAMLASCHGLAGHHEEAAKYSRKATKADPGNAQWWNHLGMDLFRMGDLDGAAEALRKACELDPHRAAARYTVARILIRRGEVGPALDMLEEAFAEQEDLRREAKSEPDFAALQGDDRFHRLISPPSESPEDVYREWIRSGA